MALTQVDPGLLSSSAQYTGFKNRIINGAMNIDQRNAGASQTITSNATYYGVDRYRLGISGTNAYSFSVQQVADAPSGFLYSQKLTVNTATTFAAGDTFQEGQRIEYSNCYDLGWFDSTGRSYVATYTINSANTWEQKTIIVPSPIAGGSSATLSFWVKSSLTGTFAVSLITTASPTWTGIGLYVCFDLGQGSTYQTSSANTWSSTLYLATTTSTKLLSNAAATLQITGVQLEKGSTPTSFDYRPHGAELQLCQRYYEKSYDQATVPGTATRTGLRAFTAGGDSAAGTNIGAGTFLAVKRAAPTMRYWDGAGTANKFSTREGGTWTDGRGLTALTSSEQGAIFDVTTSRQAASMVHFDANAEL